MPKWVDEAKWEQAKKLAKKQGQGTNYAYIMGIYLKLVGKEKKGDKDKKK